MAKWWVVCGMVLPLGCFYDPMGSAGGTEPGATTMGGEVSTTAPETDAGPTTPTSGSEGSTEDPDDTTGAICGDGVVGPGEQCDDTNQIDDDACTNACQLRNCGDGVVGVGEECDDGPGNGETKGCLPDCHLASCGDGYVQAGVEGCDDANAVDDDGCSNTCKLRDCGDGMVQDGEGCDDADADNTDECLDTCASASCGDGFVQAGVESCDEAGQNSEMGMCLPSCMAATCGDGFTLGGVEGCDDGNMSGGDGCSATCVTEECGNGIVDPNEECEDMNADDADDCRNDCFLATCGDGIVAVNATNPEQCDDEDTDNNDECPTNCKTATCGDGFVFTEMEECDDDGVSDTCDAMCKRSAYWVFTTSMKFTGSEVAGLDDADILCTMLADGKTLEGDYKAWLGDDNTTASERLYHSTVKYIRTDKTKVADNWNDLTDNSIDFPIARDENGTPISINPNPITCNGSNWESAVVWTGALSNGMGAQSCNGWSDAQPGTMGQGGLVNRPDQYWSGCTFPCDTPGRLYCIEQPAL